MNNSTSKENPVFWGIRAEVWTPGYNPRSFFPQDISESVKSPEDRTTVLDAMMKELEKGIDNTKLKIHLNYDYTDFQFWMNTLKDYGHVIDSYDIKTIDDQAQEYYDQSIKDLKQGSLFALTYPKLGFGVAFVQQFKDRWSEIKKGLFKNR